MAEDKKKKNMLVESGLRLEKSDEDRTEEIGHFRLVDMIFHELGASTWTPSLDLRSRTGNLDSSQITGYIRCAGSSYAASGSFDNFKHRGEEYEENTSGEEEIDDITT